MSELRCETLHFASADKKHPCAAYIYTMPDVPVRGVLQLSHGMCEYVQRYAPMAQFYAEHGIALAGNDHLGHGGSAAENERGHYGEPNGRFNLLNDLHTMNTLLHEKFPNVPIILTIVLMIKLFRPVKILSLDTRKQPVSTALYK